MGELANCIYLTFGGISKKKKKIQVDSKTNEKKGYILQIFLLMNQIVDKTK